MRHHDSDPHDALNDYLDSLAGAPPTDSRAGALDPDLRDGVDRFFALAEAAGLDPRASTQLRRPIMSTNLTLPASGATDALPRASRRSRSLPQWTEHLHLASTALLIVAVIALSFAAFGPNGIGRNGGNGEPSGNLAAVPVATVSPDDETSSVPYPGPEECTIEVTRDEVVADIQAANVATPPHHQRYVQAIEPSAEDAQAIMQTFREWQACGGSARQMQLQTPWFTANHLPIFFNYQSGTIERPISEEEIEAYADVLLNDDPVDDSNASVVVVADAGTPPITAITPSGQLPIPPDATPIVLEGGRSFPSIFAEDIMITGPDTAYAKVYFVNENTREVTPGVPMSYRFVKVDGQWLIDSYSEGSAG